MRFASRVMNKIPNGYPRYSIPHSRHSNKSDTELMTSFFLHRSIVAFADDIIARYSTPDRQAMLFPSSKTAQRCRTFIEAKAEPGVAGQVKIIDLLLDKTREVSKIMAKISPSVSAVIFNKDLFPIAKEYWQHTGDGISSRHAEFCHSLFLDGRLADSTSPQPTVNRKKAPRDTKQDLYTRLFQKKIKLPQKESKVRNSWRSVLVETWIYHLSITPSQQSANA